MRSCIRFVVLAAALGVAACQQAPMGADAGPATTADRTTVVAVNFDFDSHRIRPESYQALDALAAAMTSQQLAGYRFDIDGHTDIVGRLAYNIALSLLRARAVTEYLAARGVPRTTMRAQGFGPLNLADPSHPAGGVNRRVEVTSIR